MKLSLIVALGLVASSTASFKKAKPFKFNAKAIENQPKKQTVTFGDLVTFFQTHDFQVNDQLVAFLDNLNNQILEEHNQHLELYTQQRAECADEYEFRAEEIAAGEDALARSQAKLAQCAAEETRAANLGDLINQQLVGQRAQLQDLEDRRAAQIALYTQRRTSLDNAAEQLAVAQSVLNELELEVNGFVPTQFIQVVNTLLAVTVRSGHSHKILPIYTQLLQSQQDGFDIAAIQNIRERLSDLEGNVERSSQTLEDDEAANLEQYNEQKQSFEDMIQRSETQVIASNQYVSRMAGCVEQEESISLQAAGKVARNTDLLNQAHGLCDNADVEFQRGEDTRRGQLELIGQLRSAVTALESEYNQSLLPNIQDLVDLQ